MKLAVSLALILALAGCVTKPISEVQALPVPNDRLLAYQDKSAATSATVITLRDAGFTGGGCDMAVYIDGTLAARIGDREMARFYLAPGDHVIGTGPTGRGTCAMFSDRMRRETGVSLKEGETKKFRISIGNAGPGIEQTAFSDL